MPMFWNDERRQKLKYLVCIMDQSIYKREYDGWYVCGCGYKTLSYDTSHFSKIVTGYCNNGMKSVEDGKYKCVCGKIIDDCILGKRHSHTGLCIKNAERFEKYTCKICDVECHTLYDFDKHQKTQRHINKVDDPLLCKTCNIRCSSKTDFETHLATKKHKRLSEGPSLNLECSTCNIKCLSQAQMKKHLETKKHLKKMDLSTPKSTESN